MPRGLLFIRDCYQRLKMTSVVSVIPVETISGLRIYIRHVETVKSKIQKL